MKELLNSVNHPEHPVKQQFLVSKTVVPDGHRQPRKFFRAEYGRPQLRHFHMVVGIAVRLPAVHDQRSQNAQPDERNRKCEDQEDSRVFPAAELFLKLRIGIFFHGFFT